MASKVQKTCKICGKLFAPCTDCENDKTMFRWKRVACSPECAKTYFTKIETSRQPKTNIAEQSSIKEKHIETTNITSGVAAESSKSDKTRKKSVDNKESEQID